MSTSAPPPLPATPPPIPPTPTTIPSHPLSPPSPPVPLTGFRSALEHTGIPRSVLLWKPRLPSRNWTIFLTLVGSVSYLYYDDRNQSRLIRESTIERVKHLASQPTRGSLDEIRRVKVIGARWPEDDDDDRALRYFRKYVKVSAPA